MAVRTEELQLRVLIDGSPARRELAELDQEYAKLNADMKELTKGSKEYIAAQERVSTIGARQAELRKEIGLTGLTAKQLGDELRRLQVTQRNLTPNTPMWAENAQRINEVKMRLRELNDVNLQAQAAWEHQRQGIKLTNMSMQQLEQEARRLRSALHRMDPNTAEFRNLNRELLQVDDRMRVLRNNLTPMQQLWRNVKSEMSGIVGVSAALFGGSLIVGKVRDWVKGAADLSDAQADVQRTTGLTREEVSQLTSDLGKFNTRTPRSELLALAADAGKLGITGKKDIMDFVRAGDQIRVALGDDLGDEAIKNIGKLNQTFEVGRITGKNMEEQMLATGSAVNALGQASTAQESFLVGYATRMAGVNTQAEINIQNTLGYGAALDQLGQKEETASTAMAQFTLKAYKETATYARIAGMSVKDFQQLLKNDANEALLRTLEGLKGNNEGLGRMTELFSDMGQEGARAVGVLSSLANNTDLVREQQALANKEFAAGTSITNEFNAKNNTLAADLDIIGKKLASAFVNSGVVNGIKSMVGSIREWVDTPLSATIEEERQALFRMHSQILATNEGSAERVKLINEMKALYPGLLQDLNAETATNKQVAEAIRAANEQLINRIIIQQKQEEIDKEVQRGSERRQERLQREETVLKALDAATKKYNVELQAGGTVLEQAQRTYALIAAEQQKQLNGRSGGGVLFNDVARLGNAINNLRVAQSQENERLEVGNNLLAEKEELMKRLGVATEALNTGTSDGVVTTPVPDGTGAPTGEPTSDAAKKQYEQQVTAMEKLRQDLLGLREQMLVDAMSADGRELDQTAKKYDDIRAAMVATGQATTEDLLALEEAREAALLQKMKEQGEKRTAEAREQALKEQEARNKVEDEAYLESQASEADAEIVKELARMDALVAVMVEGSDEMRAVVEATEAAIAAIRKKYRTKEEQQALESRKKRIQEQIIIYQGVASALSGVNQLLAAAYDASGKANYQNTTAAKALGLAQIAIASGVGVAEAIKAGAGIPFPANLGAIATGVGAVLTGIANAVNLLKAARVEQPNATATANQSVNAATATTMPYAAKGGVFDGPSHTFGGLNVVDPRTGEVKANVEGDEPWMVLSKAFRQANPDLIPLLLRASAEGAPLTVVPRDPSLNNGLYGDVAPFNFARAGEVLEMAGGGLLTKTVRGTALVNMPTAPGSDDTDYTLTKKRTGYTDGGVGLGELVAIQQKALAQQASMLEALQRDFMAKVVLQDLERKTVEYKEVQNINRVKKVA